MSLLFPDCTLKSNTTCEECLKIVSVGFVSVHIIWYLLITILNNPRVFVYTYSNNWWKIIKQCSVINVHNGCVCYLLFSVCGASQARNALTIQWRAFYHLIVFVLSQTHDGECAGVRLTATYIKKNFVICLLS